MVYGQLFRKNWLKRCKKNAYFYPWDEKKIGIQVDVFMGYAKGRYRPSCIRYLIQMIKIIPFSQLINLSSM
jgi:hypothetical protein